MGWLAAPEGSLGWFSAVQVASALWFLGHGQSIGNGAVVISMTPLALLLVFVYIAYRWVRGLAAVQRARVATSAWSGLVLRGIVPGFVIGYAAVSVAVALLTLGGPVAPGAAAVLGACLVPAAALGLVFLRPHDEESPAFVRSWFRRGSSWLPLAWRTGWRGAAMLLGLGLAFAVVVVGLSLPDVAGMQGEYGLNVAAGAVVALAQVLLLGNAATWALAFLAGPGFQVAAGSTISPFAAEPGLMPLVPVLGALPDAADYPTLMLAVLAVPVAAGGLLGRWIDRALEFFGDARSRVSATGVAVAIAVAVVAALTALGHGAVGVDRLASVGPSFWLFVGALLGEVALGAGLHVAWAVWRERRAEAPEADSDEETQTAPDPVGAQRSS